MQCSMTKNVGAYLCATVITVAAANSRRMHSVIMASVSASTDAVASSIMTIEVPCSRALAMTRSCLCPTLKLQPPSRTTSSSDSTRHLPIEERLCEDDVLEPCSFAPKRPTRCKHSCSLLSLYSSNGSKLDRTVPILR